MLCYLTEGNVPDSVCAISLPVLADDRSHVLVAENAAARLHPVFPTPCHLPEQQHQRLAKLDSFSSHIWSACSCVEQWCGQFCPSS